VTPTERTVAALARARVVATLRFADLATARHAARAALDGGISALEVTLTTPGALDLIAELAADPRALVGAGTVVDAAGLEAAARVGARYALSPACTHALVAPARALGVLYVPGAATPTEVHAAVTAGAEVVKIFPAALVGGVAFLRALSGPFPGVRFLPTNGIAPAEVDLYLAAGAVCCGLGRELFDPARVAAGEWEAVTARCREVAGAIARGR